MITRKRGLSVMELVVGLAVLAMVIAGAYQLLFSSGRVFERASASSFGVQQARQVIMGMEREIRQSCRVVAADSGETVYEAVAADPSGTVLDIHMPMDDGEGNVTVKLVRYRCLDPDGGPLERGVADVGHDPDDYEVVVDHIINGDSSVRPLFVVTSTGLRPTVQIELVVDASEAGAQAQTQGVGVVAKFSVRARGEVRQ